MELQLRPLRLADEAAFLGAIRAMAADSFEFALDYEDGMDWGEYVAHMVSLERGSERYGQRVPASFLVAVVDGTLVGRVSVRYALNPWLARQGGHIGYGVLPDHRRRGYATEILRQAIILARERGVDRILVTCDDDNAPSARAIERCGGVLTAVVDGDQGTAIRQYWID